MNITLNGQPKELNGAYNLKDIVEQFCKDSTPVIAELNGRIVKNPFWRQTLLSDGDTVELVGFVGGG